MKSQIRTVALASALACVGGCDFVDYYPNHETTQRSTDLRKDGPGTYGGNNSNFPVGTPGTTDATPVASPATTDNGLTFNTNGQGTFSATGSYSGANTGGSTNDNRANVPGDGSTQVGTAAGH